jgi:hypothetical protein
MYTSSSKAAMINLLLTLLASYLLALFKVSKLLGELNIILDIGTTPLPQLSLFITNSLLAPGQLRQSLLKLLLYPYHIIFKLLPVLLHVSVVYYLMIKAAVLPL